MPTPTFDGDNTLIILTVDGEWDTEIDLYSEWKQWVKLSDNSKYSPAFWRQSIDQSLLSSAEIRIGTDTEAQFFLNNEEGWRIRPVEGDGETLIIGNIRRANAELPLFVPTVGMYKHLIEVEVTNRGTIEESSSSSGVTKIGFS